MLIYEVAFVISVIAVLFISYPNAVPRVFISHSSQMDHFLTFPLDPHVSVHTRHVQYAG